MTYNLTNFTNADGFLDIVVASNHLVDGWFSVLIIVMIFGITFTAMKGYELKYALLSSSVISFVLTAALWGAGIAGERALVITFVWLLFCVIVAAISD